MCISHLHSALPILFNLRFFLQINDCVLLASFPGSPHACALAKINGESYFSRVHVGNEAIVFCILGGGRHEMLDSKQIPNRQHHDAELQKKLSNTVM